MIDILRRGNQELFHSSMIAWLLDPTAEHGLGTCFLEGFGAKLADKGNADLQTEYEAALPKSVCTEVSSNRSRYDIEIRFEKTRFVVENKTKSLGTVSQLQKYEEDDVVPIALGLCDVSFSENLKYPLVLYRDILNILRGIVTKSDNKFSSLIEHYQEFLERELEILDLIDECYAQGNHDVRPRLLRLVDCSVRTENDLRFFNLFLLEKFRREFLEKRSRWDGVEWMTNKNMSSGVWLSSYNELPNHNELPNSYSLPDSIEHLCREAKTKLWFHLELKKSLFMVEDQDKVGDLQLRCSKPKKMESGRLAQNFKDAYQHTGGPHIFGRTPNAGWNSFYLVRRDLTEKVLTFDKLEEEMIDFYEQFGSFSL